MKILIGIGHLTWPRGERVTDRYGVVSLNKPTETGDGGCSGFGVDLGQVDLSCVEQHEGEQGRLTATVVSPRKSGHIGDAFNWVKPSLPDEGETILLGEGRLIYANIYGDEAGHWVGLEPLDGRETFWLDIKGLYRCHSSIVRLEFETR